MTRNLYLCNEDEHNYGVSIIFSPMHKASSTYCVTDASKKAPVNFGSRQVIIGYGSLAAEANAHSFHWSTS